VAEGSESRTQHPFHMVGVSPWPIVTSFSALAMLVGLVMIFHNITYGIYYAVLGFICLAFFMFEWWQDIIAEGTFYSRHTLRTVTGFRLGMMLFIASEIMFFFAFFWAFFNSCLNPTISIGCIWPPVGIEVFNPKGIPVLNTIILLTSGVWATYCHKILSSECYLRDVTHSLFVTIVLGFLFTLVQGYEYLHAPFNISDSIYGSAFFLTTGFHGLHVLIGTTFLIICYKRFINTHLTPSRHVSFELAIWYWHFVDVVWIFLYIVIYWWGSIF
jgi:cytochrome c oxidase subunit 3